MHTMMKLLTAILMFSFMFPSADTSSMEGRGASLTRSGGETEHNSEAEHNSCWGVDSDYQTSRSFLEVSSNSAASPGDAWGDLEKIFGSTIVWLFKMMPGMRAKLYGRSLTPPCRCEACAYTLDTLIMYLDEDTMGWYTPDDIQHIMMDRFCYGIKWLYRSACHHILSAYFDDIAAMAMGHMTGLDICRVLRFCPYYYSGGNMLFGNTFPFNIMSGSAGGSAS